MNGQILQCWGRESPNVLSERHSCKSLRGECGVVKGWDRVFCRLALGKDFLSDNVCNNGSTSFDRTQRSCASATQIMCSCCTAVGCCQGYKNRKRASWKTIRVCCTTFVFFPTLDFLYCRSAASLVYLPAGCRVLP